MTDVNEGISEDLRCMLEEANWRADFAVKKQREDAVKLGEECAVLLRQREALKAKVEYLQAALAQAGEAQETWPKRARLALEEVKRRHLALREIMKADGHYMPGNPAFQQLEGIWMAYDAVLPRDSKEA